MRLILTLLLIVAWAVPIAALEPDERLDEPALEARARALSAELRCVVCQNQSIDDSAAPLARDLRVLVRERLLAGDSDDQVLAFVTARYGDYVLLRPPVQPNTYALWFGPFAVLAIGVTILAVMAGRRRRGRIAPDPLTEDERRRVDALLDKGPDPSARANE